MAYTYNVYRSMDEKGLMTLIEKVLQDETYINIIYIYIY